MITMVRIIGAGLAGVEAANYLANKRIPVKLYEMRPKRMTPAHRTGMMAELVCSNSFRSLDEHNAVGLLKREMETIGSLVLAAAKRTSVPAGSSLAVDRTLFSQAIEASIADNPHIEVIRKEVDAIDVNSPTIIAAGPLASDSLASAIASLLEQEHLHFFDAIAPIIAFDSIDMDTCYFKSRYDKGEASYINCPMDERTYSAFYQALISADTHPLKDFENDVFEGCMPIEVMAKRGPQTVLYGPLKPVGLARDPDHRPHAVIQLRQDDAKKSMYNIVGFQTNLTWPEQKRVIRMIPGLEQARILRYGVMHKNTYIESPQVLNQSYQMKEYPNLFFAGQISGVEGYIESAASGLNAAVQMALWLENEPLKPFPEETVIGAMAHYVATPNASFKPMNANLGLLPGLGEKHRKKDRKALYRKRSLSALSDYLEDL
ncbi:MAG: methylenetetrahydrofolate--tRNA-(uracil(54)-C(5))-methyltransferase (FADH(2)-oxidizing) TrmFO [Acholeplasmataceae bacterium]